MNYEKIYHNLIQHAQHTNTSPTEYYEKHHILPRSMGGSDSKANLVKLTPRQHFIAHRLLTKFVTGEDRAKMFQATRLMSQSKSATNYRPKARIYEAIRLDWLKVCELTLNLRNSTDSKFLNIGKHTEFLGTVSDIKKISKVSRNFKKVKGYKFLNLLRIATRLGFKGIANCRSSECNLSGMVDHAIHEGYLVEDGRFKSKHYIITDKFKDLKFQGQPNTTDFHNYLYKKNQFVKGSANLGKLLIKYNKTYAGRYILNEWSVREVTLKPFNNWLTLDHPLAGYFYTPLDLKTAKWVIEELSRMNQLSEAA